MQKAHQNFSLKRFFKNLKDNVPLIVLALADVVVMVIPFYMENFIPNIYKNLGLTASQYSQAGAIYGFVSLPCYFLGSYIGDKFKSKNLILISLVMSALLGIWYLSLPVSNAYLLDSNTTAIQLDIIFAGFAFSTCGLLWGPLWKAVKNHNIENLPEEEKETKVGANNGYEGMMNGLIGLTLALIGTLLLELVTAHLLPDLMINGKAINAGFFILISIYVSLIIVSAIFTLVFIKSVNDQSQKNSFSLKSIADVLKNWQIWLLGLLVLGVYMLQMGLSSYVNYLSNIFLIPAVAVMIIGIFRTYVMRFMISGWFGKRADKSHNYILWIVIGLFIGMLLVLLGVVLPGFNNDFDPKSNSTTGIIVQVVACLNLIVLGAVTWALVTIRWSPLGSELKIKNDNYAAALNIVSVIAFTPDAFFKQIKSAIEAQHNMEFDGTIVANQTGNQIILSVVCGFALAGCVCGLVLYLILYRKRK